MDWLVFENVAQFGLAVCLGFSVISLTVVVIALCVSIIGRLSNRDSNALGIVMKVAISLLGIAVIIYVSSIIGFRILSKL